MIRSLKYTTIILLAMLVSCSDYDNNFTDIDPSVPEGYERIEFTAAGYGMKKVLTRAVDIDGGGIQDLRLFCFDRYGLFIVSARATFPDDYVSGSNSGTFTAIIPANTRCVHFIANQNMTDYPEDMFHGKSEAEALGLMEGSSGKMIYWGRVKAPDTMDAAGEEFAVSFKDYLEGLSEDASIQPDKYKDNPDMKADVWMIRNHAMIQIQNTEANTANFTTTGLAVYNHMAFGTVAPLENGVFPARWPGTTPYVTLPENRSKVSDVMDVRDATVMGDGTTLFGEYIFECENPQNDPVSVILRGTNTAGATAGQTLYYRVMLQDDKGDMVMIRRNHRYILNIKGTLLHGQRTFAEALDAPATNNVWVSISDDILEVQNSTNKLTVEKTAYVATAPTAASQHLFVYYNLEKVSDGGMCDSKPDVSWEGDQNVSENTTITDDINEYSATGWDIDGKHYNGRINLTLLYRTADILDKREGTLLIKAGQLQRKVKVMTIKEQKFEPAWASSQVYGVVNAANKTTRAHATLMFTIPETTPEELFPMRVLISTNKLDVRSTTGQVLPIVSRGQDGFGDESYGPFTYKKDPGTIDADGNPVFEEVENGTKEFDYKYVLEVTKPGVQRVYFENILNETVANVSYVFIEAEHFQTIYKEVLYTTLQNSISVNEMSDYDISATDDEKIKFYLVPMRAEAPVNFSMVLKTGRGAAATIIAPNGNSTETTDVFDEFLLYSQYLDAPDETVEAANPFNPDIFLKESRTAFWTTNGRCHLFWTRDVDHGAKEIKLRLKTNRARSDEPVRIASNESEHSYINIPAGSTSPEEGVTEEYLGRKYRTFVFELNNYHPFRFAAQMSFDGGAYQGTYNTGDNAEEEEEEEEEAATFPYAALDTPVKLAFDVTSFHSNPRVGISTIGSPVSVEPFGQEFEIYIDAPMLKLDPNAQVVKDGKLYKHPSVPGRFVYKVEATRDAERAAAAAAGIATDVAIADNARIHWEDAGKSNPDSYTPNQVNERKVLPFLTNSIVTAGNISFSADESKVVFYEKNFKVVNSSKEGRIYYMDGTAKKLIPEDKFVVVQRDYDHVRLASMSITTPANDTAPNYALRLRKEYSFSWTDTVELLYTVNGAVYTKSLTLRDLCGAAGNEIVLEKEP